MSHPLHAPGGLRADQRGAIALLALFMAVLLAAAAFYLVGIGDAVLQHERMQDAADATAFSAAVLHARGMNLLALMNMIMAALLAILVALKLAELLATIALVVIAISSYFAPGLAAATPIVTQLRSNVRSAHDELRDPIHQALEVMHTAGTITRAVVPAAATLVVFESVRGDYAPEVTGGIAVPGRLTLPTKDGKFSELCDKAGEYVGGLTEHALRQAIGDTAELVAAAQEGLVAAGTQWFCGEDGSPPSHRQRHVARYPRLPSRERCAAYEADTADYSAPEHEALCAQAERDEAMSIPDPDSGECRGECDPDLYALRAELARRDCAPRAGNDHLRSFSWQEREYRREYQWRKGSWHVGSSAAREEAGARYRLASGNQRPCGGRRATLSTDWEADPTLPLCSDAAPPSAPGREGERVVRSHVDVVRIFGCAEPIERRYAVDEPGADERGGGQGEGENRKVPQVLEDGVELGDEDFQVRAAVIGQGSNPAVERLIEIASWRPSETPREDAPPRLDALLGRTAFAQAEYFYAVESADPAERASFLWNMRWQARLRRFRVPSEARGFLDAFGTLCSQALGAISQDGGSACTILVSAFGQFAH